MYRGVNRNGPQYLENLATGYWFSEVLYTAVELEIFSLIEPGGRSSEEISISLGIEPRGAERFLQALCAVGLLINDGGRFYNTKVSSEFLVIGKEDYQGDSILWRKQLFSNWRDLADCLKTGGRVKYDFAGEAPVNMANRIKKYISAMDSVARTKVREMTPFFEGIHLRGKILDVGAGSGAISAGFLEIYPEMTATLMDLREVLDCTREKINQQISERLTFCPANILETWPVDTADFELIILSNIIHAYSEEEVLYILKKASDFLKPGGFILIHDFYLEHYPEKAALFDLNMFVNTYNGKVFSHQWVQKELLNLNLHTTEIVPLETDTALIIAAKSLEDLSGLKLNPIDRLNVQLKTMGFDEVCPISAEDICVADWVEAKCRLGCERYGMPHCPPNSPTSKQTKDILKDYSHAVLLKGQPPTKEFQQRALLAEKQAFKAGFYKAMVFWAGPCSLCDNCTNGGYCRNIREARNSMEGAGIDVFRTVRQAGFAIDTLKNKNDFVTYFGLLLLE